MPLAWSGTSSSKIASVSRSQNGTIALVSTDGDRQTYWLVAADGSLATLDPAPNQPFAPLADWLDDARLLVLSTDKFQESRLAVVNLTTKTIQQSSALSGVRFFCVSPDARYVAAATASAVYAGPVEALLGTSAPPTVATLDPSTPTVVWALTFDDTGTRLAMLSATLTPDGRPTNVRELGYAQASSSWTKVFDSPTSFGLAYDQVWLP
jgi:dipeptidyl aminopeptidase/acylaminoacyl peptidase